MTQLTPQRYKQRDFFVADFRDISIKDDLPSMEHPMFALRPGDKRVRRYEKNGHKVEVQPGTKGLATIHDKDIWIYCISQLVEAINLGREDISRVVQFTAYDFLVATSRSSSGRSYQRMADALGRLSGTRIETNIATGNQKERAGFGLIDAWRVIEAGPNNQMLAIEVTLPDWLYRSVLEKRVLTLSPKYFRIRKPLDRRLYELARKHCGHQSRWKVSLEVLHHKSGSAASRREFRRSLRMLTEANELPDYKWTFNAADDMVTVYSKKSLGQRRELRDLFG